MPENDRSITVAIFLSILLHLFLLLMVLLPPPVKTAEPELEVFLNKQIADISPPLREEKPERAKFLGLYDSRVEEEQVVATPYLPPYRRRVVTGADGRELPNKGEGTELAAKGEGKEQPEEGEFSSQLPEDFFPNIRIRDKTYLNVQRYPKIAYFVWLIKSFKLTWNPQPVIARYYFMNQLTTGVLETVITFDIDREGNLSRAWIYRSSGLPGYDEEALRTVTASAPFPAPPPEVLALDGNRDDFLSVFFTFTAFL